MILRGGPWQELWGLSKGFEPEACRAGMERARCKEKRKQEKPEGSPGGRVWINVRCPPAQPIASLGDCGHKVAGKEALLRALAGPQLVSPLLGSFPCPWAGLWLMSGGRMAFLTTQRREHGSVAENFPSRPLGCPVRQDVAAWEGLSLLKSSCQPERATLPFMTDET